MSAQGEASSLKRARADTPDIAKQPKRSERWYEEDGDIEIETSDGYLIKTHAYHLQSASAVFRDMIKDATSSRIHLSDNALERDEIVARLLRIVVHGGAMEDYMGAAGFRAIRLMHKYGFDRTLNGIKIQVERELYYPHSNIGCPEIFVLGVALRKLKLCVKAIDGARDDDTCQPRDLGVEEAELIGTRPMLALLWALEDTVDDAAEFQAETMSYNFGTTMERFEKEFGGMW